LRIMEPSHLIRSLRLVSWIICGIYATIPTCWLMVHPFADRWRKARYKLELLVPLWIAMWCVAWAVSYPWRYAEFHQGPEGWALAPYLWMLSLFLYSRAVRGLTAARIIGRQELHADAASGGLVTDGIHGVVRHPLYLGHLFTMASFAVGAATVACVGLFLFTVAMGSIMIVFEERELRCRFGAEWDAYCKRTAALIPIPRL